MYCRWKLKFNISSPKKVYRYILIKHVVHELFLRTTLRTWRECNSFSSSKARAPSLLSPSSTSASSSTPGRQKRVPRCRELHFGSMLITEKATPPSCSPTPIHTRAAPGKSDPTTRSWSARRSGGIKRSSAPERRERPQWPLHRAQVRIPPPLWRLRGTSPALCPALQLFSLALVLLFFFLFFSFPGGQRKVPAENSPPPPSSATSSSSLSSPGESCWWRSAFLGQRWPYWRCDRRVI